MADPSLKPDPEEARDLRRALRHGLLCRCPACGKAPLFDGYLTVKARCPACGTDLHEYRAADAPAFFTMTIVGLILIPVIAWYFVALRPDPLTMAVVLSIGMTALTLLLLRPTKGAVIGFLWSQKERDRGA